MEHAALHIHIDAHKTTHTHTHTHKHAYKLCERQLLASRQIPARYDLHAAWHHVTRDFPPSSTRASLPSCPARRPDRLQPLQTQPRQVLPSRTPFFAWRTPRMPRHSPLLTTMGRYDDIHPPAPPQPCQPCGLNISPSWPAALTASQAPRTGPPQTWRKSPGCTSSAASMNAAQACP